MKVIIYFMAIGESLSKSILVIIIINDLIIIHIYIARRYFFLILIRAIIRARK